MRKLIVLFIAGLVVGAPTLLSAQSVSNRVVIESLTEFIPCANAGEGEMVSGDIILHAVIHTTKEGRVTRVHVNVQGGTLTGESTGTVYQASGRNSYVFDNPEGAYTQTSVNEFHYVGQGGVRYRIFTTNHTTLNANGELTSRVDNVRVDCQ